MNRSIIVYSLLLLGSLGWAYQTWTHEDELALHDKVVLLPGKPESITEVTYRSDALELTLVRREDEQGSFTWGRSVPTVEPAAPAPEGDESGGEPPAPAPPPPAGEPEQFKVGKAGDALLESLAPLVAKRKLEGVADSELEALGLADPEAVLEITREGKEPRRFELGGNVFGGANVYVRDPEDGSLYLVDAQLMRSLRGGARTLPDRDLTGIDERKVERLTLRVGDRQASFSQHNPDDAEARYWSVLGEDEPNPTVKGWADKILRMRSSRYLQDGETPADLAPAFDVRVEGQDRAAVTVEVLRSFDDEGQEQYFARSGHTRGLVRLPRSAVAEASADLESVLASGGA